jgi:hypothetical protein
MCWYLNQLELDPGPLYHGEYDLVPSPQTKSPLLGCSNSLNTASRLNCCQRLGGLPSLS